jgi:hypothetical protein
MKDLGVSNDILHLGFSNGMDNLERNKPVTLIICAAHTDDLFDLADVLTRFSSQNNEFSP